MPVPSSGVFVSVLTTAGGEGFGVCCGDDVTASTCSFGISSIGSTVLFSILLDVSLGKDVFSGVSMPVPSSGVFVSVLTTAGGEGFGVCCDDDFADSTTNRARGGCHLPFPAGSIKVRIDSSRERSLSNVVVVVAVVVSIAVSVSLEVLVSASDDAGGRAAACDCSFSYNASICPTHCSSCSSVNSASYPRRIC